MKRVLLAALLLAWSTAAFAQADVIVNFRNSNTPTPVSPTFPLPVTGTFSATLSGFTATSTGTPISVTTGGVTGTLPAGAVVVATNVGSTNGAYCALGASATTASQYIAPNGGWFSFTVGASTQLTCITLASTTTVNMTGGTGLPTGTGGGGGGSGGAVTQGTIPWVVALNTTPTIANGNGTVPTQGGAVLSATNPSFASITDGTNKAAVKAANTAPTTSDPGLVTNVNCSYTGSPCITLGPATVANSVPVTENSFTPSTSGSRGTPFTVTTSNSSGTLPTGTSVVVSNVGTTNPMYCNVEGVAATTADQLIAANGGWFSFGIPTGVTTLNCIATGGSTTANMVGGTGLPTGTGGGGGSGGAVTQGTIPWADNITTWGGTTLGAASNYGTSPGAVEVPGVNAFVTNVPAVSQSGTWNITNITGTVSLPTGAATSANQSTEITDLGTIITSLGTINTSINSAVPVTVNGTATGATGLTPGTAQTGTIIALNTDQTSLGGVAYGAMANYGTSPGAVKVPGVNAFITNSPSFALNTTPTLANGNGVVPTQGGAVLSATNGMYTNLLQGNAVLSATNGIFNNVLQGNAVLSATNPSFASITDGTNKAAVKAANTAPTTSDPGLVANVNCSYTGSPCITLGPAAVANAVPVTQSSQYPTNAVTTTPTAVTATTTGTTAAVAASLAATASVTNYVCGFDVTADATALTTGTATLSGTISGSLNYLQTVTAVANGASQFTRTFNPCIPASAANTAITMTSAAAGTGGNTIVNIWGYRL